MKKLYRSRENKIIAGICGGIGKYFNIDPTLVRILWILFLFAGGAGIIAYIIAWIIIPLKSKAKNEAEVNVKSPQDQGVLWGSIILIVIGVILLFHGLGFLWGGLIRLWPLILIAIGVALLIKYFGKKTPDEDERGDKETDK
jgi:phage shock protein PspC (stress-responsive transcriptional regulator)